MQLTIIANRTNQLADKQINNLLAGQRIVGCADNTLRLAGGRTLAVTNDGRGIIDRNAATWAFEQNIHSALPQQGKHVRPLRDHYTHRYRHRRKWRYAGARHLRLRSLR